MNRHAAVLAADSASTVSRWVDDKWETRYFKGANKIFQLSHHQPVGIMIFNAAELLHVPWEILIKSFRDELAGKTFNSLEGYADEFFQFLDGNVKFFPEQVQKDEMLTAAHRAAFQLVFGVEADLTKMKETETQTRLRGAIDGTKDWLDKAAFPKRISEEHARQFSSANRESVSDGLKFLELPDDLREALADCAMSHLIKAPGASFGTAGLVFAGFGDHDIFPHMIEYESSGMLQGIQIIGEKSRAAADQCRMVRSRRIAPRDARNGPSGAAFIITFEKTRGKRPNPDKLTVELISSAEGGLTWAIGLTSLSAGMKMLLEICESGPGSQQELANKLAVSEPRVSQMLQPLRDKGLVTRKGLSLTNDGREQAEQLGCGSRPF